MIEKRRGLSNVIGMIFLVVVLSSTIGYFTYGVNLLETLNDQIVTKNTDMQNKFKETFEVSSAKIVNGKLDLTLQNTGDLPINFTRIWVSNVTDSSWPLQNFTINKIATPGEILTNVGADIPLYIVDTQGYSLKLITQRGNSEDFSINSPNQEPIDIKLIALPQTVSDGFLTTLLMTVTNNMTNNNVLLNIAPILQTPQTTGTASYNLISNADPTQIDTLAKGDTAYFTWTYEISGDVGNTVTFTGLLQNGFPQNTASTSVTINDVLLAQQSSTTLSVNTGTAENNDILIFHSETDNTPSGEYQMFSGDADVGGTTVSVETDEPKFFTNHGVSVNIPAGNWNASLTYFSLPYPDSLLDDDSNNMILHFEGNVAPVDSTGNTVGHSLGSGNQMPFFVGSIGPHNSGAFDFDGGDYIELNSGGSNDVKKAPDTTTLWFKATDGISTGQILYHASKSNDDEYYEIGIDASDNVYFEFLTQKNKIPTRCESSGFDYENNNWQHLVAVRPNHHQCELYINATSVSTSSLGDGDDDIHIDEIFIGANDDTSNLGFDGIIDDVLHWDDYALSTGEITDLKNTNYGAAAHNAKFSIDKTDANGVFQSNIVTDNNYPLKFLDGGSNGDFLDSYNYTANISATSFASDERLEFGISDVSGLDMDMRIDDTALVGLPDTSYLQYPGTLDVFASYITFAASSTIDLTVYNVGPSSIWITFDGTRLTFEDTASSNTYAAVILSGNGTSNGDDITSVKDSIAFSFDSILDLTFSTAKNPPATTGSTGLIPAGNYKMNMHITGYDIDGKSITRTINFGLVAVT